MRPERHDIAAPEFTPGTRWLNAEPKGMSLMTSRGAVLVHFFDFAQLNSARSLPYAIEWDRRYGDAGLTTIAVHSPRHPFTADPHALEAAVERLGIAHPVADDSAYSIWHDYGCEGWPSLFLWGRGGVLRWFHFGEGEYEGTELAIQGELRELDATAELPPPMEPLRPTDAPGAIVAAPTPEVFPGGSAAEPWTGGAEELVFDYSAAGAFASVDGRGMIAVSLDDGAPITVSVAGPGLIPLAEHPRHSDHEIALRAESGVRIWALSFAPGIAAR
jgi:hypothetical protein